MEPDPFDVLGLDRAATVDDVQRARRRLAMLLHPDRGGDAARMQAINAAADAALSVLAGGVAADPDPQAPPAPSRQAPADASAPWRRVASDSPSFTVEALPVEAFEALVIVASWIGDVLVDDPPYVLDTHLLDPFNCWCRLEVVPDAGASTVSITVASVGDHPLPDVDDVRDAWVANLNRLDWDRIGGSRQRPS